MGHSTAREGSCHSQSLVQGLGVNAGGAHEQSREEAPSLSLGLSPFCSEAGGEGGIPKMCLQSPLRWNGCPACICTPVALALPLRVPPHPTRF